MQTDPKQPDLSEQPGNQQPAESTPERPALPVSPLAALEHPAANLDASRENNSIELVDTSNIPPRALLHLQQHPFRAPSHAHECSVWFEGTFDPIGPHHLEIIQETLKLGFSRVNLGVVFQNPYKPQSSSFEHRHEMARRALENVGITVFDSPDDSLEEPGVFIPTDKRTFDDLRLRSLWGKNNYVLLGPDNFEKAISQNTLWTHTPEIQENPHADRFFGFRRMYNKIPGFKETVLVYPGLHNIHATDIRAGRAKGIDVVTQYAQEQELYAGRTDHKASSPSTQPTLKWGKGVSLSADSLRHELSQDLSATLPGHGFAGDAVAFALHSALSRLDHSELIELNNYVEEYKSALDREFEGQPQETASIELSPASRSLQFLTTALTQSIFTHENFQVTGADALTDLYRDGKKLLFIGNHSGWGDATLLSHALRSSGLRRIADGLTHTEKDEHYSSQFAKSILGAAANRIIIPRSTNLPASPALPPYEEAMRIGLDALRSPADALALFPENECSPTAMNSFGTHFMETLTAFSNSGGLPSDLVIVPWCQVGGANFSNGKTTKISSSRPIQVVFGEPLPAESLTKHANNSSPQVVAHLLGDRVASLLPTEHRGPYGEGTQSPSTGVDSLIAQARELQAQINQRSMKETG